MSVNSERRAQDRKVYGFIYNLRIVPFHCFFALLKAPKICINPNPYPNTNPNLNFGFTHIFEEAQRNIQTWCQVTGMFFKTIMHYVCSEWLVSWYHCNFQVINCRMIYNLLTLLAFIWMRCEAALAYKSELFIHWRWFTLCLFVSVLCRMDHTI